MKYITAAETAKIVRASLKAAFPAVKFSVHSKTYSGGASIDVEWTDGPTSKDVEKVAQHYEGASFDGSIDLKTNHSYMLNGEQVQSHADYIFCHRRLSLELLKRAAAQVSKEYKVTEPLLRESSCSGAYAVEDYTQRIGMESVARVVTQAAYAMTA